MITFIVWFFLMSAAAGIVADKADLNGLVFAAIVFLRRSTRRFVRHRSWLL